MPSSADRRYSSVATTRDSLRTVPESLLAESLILGRVAEAARTLTGADAVAVLLLGRERDVFLPPGPSAVVGLDERWQQPRGLEAAQRLAAQAAAARDIVEVRAAEDSLPNLDLPLLDGARRAAAATVVPLNPEGEWALGVLQLYNASPHAAPMDRAVLRACADLASVALASAGERDRAHALAIELAALHEASKVLVAELSLDNVLQRIVEAAMRLVGARYGALGVVGPDGSMADFVTAGLSDEERGRIGQPPRGDGLLGVLLREGRSLNMPDISGDPRRVGFPPGHPNMTSLLGLPIRVHGQVVGSLYLTDKIGAPAFSEDDQRHLELLTGYAGIAIANARLYRREQDAHHALENALRNARESEARFATAFRAAPTPMSILRADDGRVTLVNDAFLQWSGSSLDEIVGRTVQELGYLAPPGGRERTNAELQSRGVVVFEAQPRLESGAERAVLASLAHIELGGEPHVLATVVDITERKRSEARLRLLAEAGEAFAESRDLQAMLDALARVAVPALADLSCVMLLDDAGALSCTATAYAHPSEWDRIQQAHLGLATPPERVDRIAHLQQVLRSREPMLLTEVTDADLAGWARDDAHLAQLRAMRISSCLLLPLAVQHQALGVALLARAVPRQPFDAADLTTASDLARRATLALLNARLLVQSQELTAMRERERISRDLHDGIIQDIYAGILQLEALAEDTQDPATRAALRPLGAFFSGVITDLRTYILGLRARGLGEKLLGEGIVALTRDVEMRSGLSIAATVEGTPYRFPDEVANALLHIAREALSNVVKHAGAARAQVRVRYDAEGVTLTVTDDGQGFDQRVEPAGGQLGLRNLRARAEELGGSCTVRSAPGTGTTITVHIPATCAEPH